MKRSILLLSLIFILFSCKEKKDTSQSPKAETTAKTGLEYAQATQQLLGQNLNKAMQEKGVLHALEFCNVQALPLTQKMEKEHNAVIKRVSDRNRNPGNSANKEELYYIASFKKQIAEGEDPEPVLVPSEGKTRFYYPIITNKMCLQCHGKPEEMQTEVLQKIKLLYPQDKALGYSENEVRGIWSIEY